MTVVITPNKPLAVNPLKMSQPLGAALAFLGVKGMMPLFHGSQGCTAFAKVILVRHFREAIPMSTTAMTEVSTILGGQENIEQAILTLVEKSKPEIIGLLTTGLTEARGDDIQGILKTIRLSHPELDNLPIVFVSTPDFKGAMEDGYATVVAALAAADYGLLPNSSIPKAQDLKCHPDQREGSDQIDYTKDHLPKKSHVINPRQVTILAGSLLSPGDVEEIKEIVAAFGLKSLVLPDLSVSLDGHLALEYQNTTSGGTTVGQLKHLGASAFTVAIGESMRKGAEILEQKFKTPYRVFPRLSGLKAVDEFIWQLSQTFNTAIPEKYLHQRCQLQDAILDSHFYFGGKRICLALEPDLLYQTTWLLKEMGAEIQGAVTTTRSPLLKDLPIDKVIIGDLEDLEDISAGADLLITNSHGTNLANKLHIPLYRLGYPIFDRLGNGQRCLVGYRGSCQMLFDLGNLFIDVEASRH